MFTFLPLPEISNLMEEFKKDKPKRVPHHALAHEFVTLIHGSEEADIARNQNLQLFRSITSTAEPSPPIEAPVYGNPRSPKSSYINPQSGNRHAPQTNFANMPSMQATLPRSLVFDTPFSKILWSAGMVASKSEGTRIVSNMGVNVGSRPGIRKYQQKGGDMPDELKFTPCRNWHGEKTNEFIIDDELLILRLGKWKLKLVNIVSDEKFEELGLTAPGWDDLKNAKDNAARKTEPTPKSSPKSEKQSAPKSEQKS